MTTLTEYEWRALNGECNLSDGHAHESLVGWMGGDISSLQAVVEEADRISCRVAYERFLDAFFRCAGQFESQPHERVAVHYSASVSIEIVANILRSRSRQLGRPFRVGLVHPTFDNIPSILLRHDVELVPLEEERWNVSDDVRSREIDGVFLVCPNNPTGVELDRTRFHEVVSACRDLRRLLIVDFSFRWFSGYLDWSQYAYLNESGVDFLAIEDTGKAWPALDLKVGMLAYSSSLRAEVHVVQNDVLLNVSPFVLLLLEYLMRGEDFIKRLRDLVLVNRCRLRDALDGSVIEIPDKSTLSVEWLRLPGGWDSFDVAESLARDGIFVLPGGPFFWANPGLGRQFLRLALLRPRVWFGSAVERFARAVGRRTVRRPGDVRPNWSTA